MLRPFAYPVACCWMLLRKVWNRGQTFQPTTPNILLFRDRRSVVQQCWIRLHSSSNITGATHAHYAGFTKTYGLYPSHDALQVPTLLGVVVHHCQHARNNSQRCWRNNVGSCCVHLQTALNRRLFDMRWYCPARGRIFGCFVPSVIIMNLSQQQSWFV